MAMAFTAAESTDSVMISCEIKDLGSVSEIVKLLECPICRGVPYPPIWNCMSGHIACDQCHSRMSACGLCRKSFASGGRNLFMEAVVSDCDLTCPFAENGCKGIFKGNVMKTHVSECQYGPTVKWVACTGLGSGLLAGLGYPSDSVPGGIEGLVRLFVIRASHRGSQTPGKLFEYIPPGSVISDSLASLAWGGGEHKKLNYEVLVAKPNEIDWIPSENGVEVPNAIVGGRSETGEVLFIGRYKYKSDLVNGKIHPSHKCCYIGVGGCEKASKTYEILVKKVLVKNLDKGNKQRSEDDDMLGYYS